MNRIHNNKNKRNINSWRRAIPIVLAIFLLFLFAAKADIAIGTVKTIADDGQKTLSIPSVNISGSNRALVVAVLLNDNLDQRVNTVTLDPLGVNEPLIWLSSAAGNIEDDGYCVIYGLVNPPTGTYDIEVDLTASTQSDEGLIAGAWPLTGVDQANPFRTAAGNEDTSGNASVTVDSEIDDIVLGAAFVEGYDGSRWMEGSDTEDWDLEDGPLANDISVGQHKDGAATSTTLNWTNDSWSGKWCAIGVAVAPAKTTIGDGTSPANKDVAPNSTNNAVDAFTLSTDSAGTVDTVTALTVTFAGTAVADVATNGVKIYDDSTGGTPNEWDAGDTLKGTASFSGTTADVTVSISVDSTPTQYLVTYDIAAGATDSNTLQGSITAATVSNILTNNDTTDATLTVSSVGDIQISTGRFTLNTGTGTQQVTGVGFQPKAYILFYTKNNSDDFDSTAGESLLSIGMTDGTNQFCMTSGAEDGQTSGDVGRRGFSDRVLASHDAQSSQTVDGEASHFSMIADGFTININDDFADPANPLIHYIAFGGDGLSVDVDTVDLADAMDDFVDVTAPGFEADVVIASYIGVFLDQDGASSNDCHSFSLGWAVNPDRQATGNQFSMSGGSEDGSSPSSSSSRFDNVRAGTSPRTGGTDAAFEIGSFDGSGFNVTTRLTTANTNEIMGYMALKLGSSPLVYTVARPARTSAGNDVESNAGLEPIFLMGIGGAVVTTANSDTDGESVTIGITDGTDTYAISQFTADNVSTTNSHCRVTSTQFMSANLHSGAIDWEATFTSFNSDGWTINYGDAAGSAYQNAFLAIGTVAAAGGTTTTIGDGSTPANKDVAPDSTNNAVNAFTLATDSGTDTVTALEVTFTGTNVADVASSGVKIYEDDGTTANEWDSGDTLKGTASFSGTTADVSVSISVDSTPTQYLVTYDIASGATDTDTLQGAITAATVGLALVNNDTNDATLTISDDVLLLGSWGTGTSHTKPDGANRALLFIVGAEVWGDEPTLTSVTYGGQSLTKITDVRIHTDNHGHVEIWMLDEAGIAAASGTTFVPTWNVAPEDIAYSHAFFSGVHQTNPIYKQATDSTVTTTPNPITTAGLSTNNGDMVVVAAGAFWQTGTYAPQNGFTEGNDQQVVDVTLGTAYKAATGSTETPSMTHSDASGSPYGQVIAGVVLRSVDSPVYTEGRLLGWWRTGLTHPAESGNDRVLVFVAAAEKWGSTRTLTSVTYGGQSLSYVDSVSVELESGTSNMGTLEVWILDEAGIAAASGDTFTPTWDGSLDNEIYSSAFFSGVNQTTPTGAKVTNSGASPAPNPITTAGLSTSSGDMVVTAAMAGYGCDKYTPGNGFSEGNDHNANDKITLGTAYKEATGATETPSMQNSDYTSDLTGQLISGVVIQKIVATTTTYSSVCTTAYWGSPDWAGQGSEAARDARYGTRHYTSLNAWESARNRDLTTANEIEVCEIVGDDWSTPDATAVTIDGWITDSTRYIEIKTIGDAYHNGIAGSGYVLDPSSTGIAIEVDESFTRIEGIEITGAVSGGWGHAAIYLYAATDVIIDKVLIHDCLPGSYDMYGLTFYDGGGGKVINSIFYNGPSNSAAIRHDSTAALYVYNTTTYNWDAGIENASSGTVTVKNCAVFGNGGGGDDFLGTMTIDNCASDDGDGTDPRQPSDWSAVFVDYTGGNFHLKSTDTDLKDWGTDLQSEGGFSDDIDGETRSGTWDIGADEYVSAATTTIGDGTSPANKDVAPMSTKNAVNAFTLVTDTGTDTVTALEVTFTGTAVADVATGGVKIWDDSTGGTPNEWDAGDTLKGTASFSGDTASVTVSISVDDSATQYLVTYDIASGATETNTLQGAITDATVTNTLVNNDTTDATLTICECDTPQVYTTVGSYTYTVPAGCDTIIIQAFGAGGGGAWADGSADSGAGGGAGSGVIRDSDSTVIIAAGGGGGGSSDDGVGDLAGGGGGGGYAKATFSTTGGATFTVVVGEGGERNGPSSYEGGDGGDPGGGAGGTGSAGGDGTGYWGGGGGGSNTSGDTGGDGATYGGGGGADESYDAGNATYGGAGASGSSDVGACGTSTYGGAAGGTGNRGGGGGGYFIHADGTNPDGSLGGTGDDPDGGAAANGGPGDGGDAHASSPTNGGNGKVIITASRSNCVFSYRKKITIDAGEVFGSTDHLNFPFLVSLSGNWLRTTTADPANGHIENSNGYDIIFKDTGGTKLDHEIESYDGSATGGSLVAWVRIPTLSHNTNTVIYMYYGSSCISSSQEDVAGVWDDSYVGVWHLKDTPDGIQHDNTSSNTGTGSSITVSHTTGVGDNRLMLVGISGAGTDPAISSVKYNDVSLTLVGTYDYSGFDDWVIWIYKLVAPDTGTHNVVVNFSTAPSNGGVVGVSTFFGVDQENPTGTFVSDWGWSATASVNVSSAPGELVFDTLYYYEYNATVGSDQTQRWNAASGITTGAGSTEPGAGSVNMSWDLQYDDAWCMGAVPIKPASTSASAYDSTSNNNNGTFQNMDPADQVSGRINGSLDFDGSNDYVEIANESNFDFASGDVSVSAWIYSKASQPAYAGIVSKYTSSADSGWSFQYDDTEKAVFEWCDSGTYYTAVTNGNIPQDQWTHVVGEVEGTTIKFYVNGALQTTTDQLGGRNTNNNAVWFGQDGDDNAFFQGTIDEVRISNTSRKADWIETEHNNQKENSTFYDVDDEEDISCTFSYRKAITIQSSEVVGSSDHLNFPMLVSLSGDWLKTTAEDSTNGRIENSNGYDIIFKDSNLEQLDHEIEEYDGSATGGTLVAWVRIPTLYYNTNTVIYMYYGNPCIDSSTENVTGVWDDNYKGVWHLHDDFVNSIDNNSATENGSVNATGRIADGQNFDNSDDYASPIVSGLPSGSASRTLSCWFKPTSDTLRENGGFLGYPYNGEGLGTNNWFELTYSNNDAGAFQKFTLHFAYNNDSSTNTFAPNNWYHLVATYDGSSAKLYVNKALEINETVSLTTVVNSSDENFNIGDVINQAVDTPRDGIIDEVRISDTNRLAEWIETEFNNQKENSTFFIEGNEDDLGDCAYAFYKPITIESDEVFGTSDHTDFPFLINIASDNDLRTTGNDGDVVRSEGYDIIFRDSYGRQLDHEIEQYEPTSGKLVAWVRIPTLSLSVDTVIYMYYGNSCISSSTENADGVWNANYKGVWHLKESGTGAADEFVDSSGTGNHGQGGGGTGGPATVVLENSNRDEMISGSPYEFSFGFTATAGRLLIAAIATDKSAGSYTKQADWTEIATYVSSSTSHALYYKVADGTETSYTFTWNGDDSAVWVGEYSGLTTTPFDQWAQDDSGTSTTQSQTTGTTPTTTQADEFLFASWSADSGAYVDGGRSYTNGFTEVDFLDAGSSGNPGLILAAKSVSATGAYSETFNTTDAGDQMSGIIATFKIASIVDNVPTQTSGRISYAQDFDGSGDYVEDSDAENFLNGLTAVTVSAWIKSGGINTDKGIISYSNPPSDSDRCFSIRYDSAGQGGGDDVIKVAFGSSSADSASSQLESSSNVQTTNWQYVVATWQANEVPHLFINGEEDTPTQISLYGASISGLTSLLIGKGIKDDQASEGWDGLIDEVRISNTARSAGWIKTCYYNQKEGSTFYIIGGEENYSPTAVDLISFTATGQDESVLVEWETAQEIDNLGFNLYRSIDPDGSYTKLNSSLIPGLISSVIGRKYTHIDKDVTRNVLYYYMLEDLDLDGTRTMHGPVCVDWDGDGIPDDYVEDGDDDDSDDDTEETPKIEIPVLKLYEVDFGSGDWTPSSSSASWMKLASFRASQQYDGVSLEWETSFEVDILGFHVYRELDGKFYRITADLVPGSVFKVGASQELPGGQHYVYWDGLSERTGRELYWLDCVELNGGRASFGPIEPEVYGPPIPERLKRRFRSVAEHQLSKAHAFGKIRALREKLSAMQIQGSESRSAFFRSIPRIPSEPRLPPREAQWVLAAGSAVKIFIEEEGWYRIGEPELIAAGLDPGIDPRYLQLYKDGQEQCLRVTGSEDGRFDEEDAIEFYATGLDTPFTDTSVYWLVVGSRPGRRLDTTFADIRGGLGRGMRAARGLRGRAAPLSFPFSVELEERTFYFAALKNGEEESFFGSVVYTEPVALLITIPHPDPSPPEQSVLEVMLQGATDFTHQIKIMFNSVEVGEVVFSGQERGVVEIPIPQGYLLEGDNIVTLEAQGGSMDVSLVDYIRLTYWRTYTADEDALKFTARGREWVSIGGFSSPEIRVVDITDPTHMFNVGVNVKHRDSDYDVTFRVPWHGERNLVALTEEKIKEPVGIAANLASSWHEKNPGAEVVIIAHKDLLESVRLLRELRESQGWSVALIDVEDLYDEFSFGAKNPWALKDFLSMAYDNWNPKPRFVLLVGDASYDPRDYLGFGDFDLVPTKFVDTEYLKTASDDWFVDIEGDGLPEMAVGRLPVESAEQSAAVVSKIIAFEDVAGLMNEVLLVADDDAYFGFEAASTEIKDLLPEDIIAFEIFRGQSSTARSELLDSLNQGQLLVNYIGHGSTEIWKGSLFTSSDAWYLTNSPYLPFFVNMTCLNGFFQDPYIESMAEALMKAEQGGAVAVWASSGLTYPEAQWPMNQELIRVLFNGQGLTIGEAVMRAKEAVSNQDIRKTWILFGDPTTKLR